jgi:hypothetical protein
VEGLGRAHEDVVAALLGREAEGGEELFEAFDDGVNVLARRAPGPGRAPHDVDAVLVRARQEQRLDAALPPVARQTVGHHRRVQVPEVRQAVRVIDGSCDVEGCHKSRVISRQFSVISFQ